MTEVKDIWIKSVDIINYQSHLKTHVEFVNGTNALIGESNHGKTAILRAIRWCLLNQPKGTEFITVGQSEAVVTVNLSNNKSIERRRNRTNVNLYRLYENGELKEEYTGFGSSVPPDIVEAHGIEPISDGIYFQFAGQLEAPFMLSLRPSQRAAVLGDLEELAQIDRGLTSVNEDLRYNAKRKKEIEKAEKTLVLEIDKVRIEAKRLKEKADILKSLKKGIEGKVNLQSFLKDKLVTLRNIRVSLVDLDGTLSKVNKVLDAWPDNLEERIQRQEHLENHIRRLREIKAELNSIRYIKDEKLMAIEKMASEIDEKISGYRHLTNSLQSLKTNSEALNKVEGSYSERVAAINMEKLDLEISKYNTLFAHLEHLWQISKQLKEADSIINEAVATIDEALDEAVNALKEDELCDRCGQSTHGVCRETVELVL